MDLNIGSVDFSTFEKLPIYFQADNNIGTVLKSHFSQHDDVQTLKIIKKA